MLKNYLLVALRNMKKQKFYSFINILGLAIGITCSFLIFLYISNELSYDKFYPQGDNIYRLGCTNNFNGKIDSYANAPRPIMAQMKQIYPEIVQTTRVCGLNGLFTHKVDIEYDNKTITSERAFSVDSTFFEVFQNEFIRGDAQTCLREPLSVVITESMARRLFGNEDPYGKTVLMEGIFEVPITGVIKDLPGNTHFEYDIIVPWVASYRFGEEDAWYGWHTYQYMLLAEGADWKTLEAKFPAFYEEYMKERFDNLSGSSELFLQPIKNIHLKSNLTWEMYPNGNITNVYAFTIIAIFLLVIACINYMNLATARSFRRNREVGMRKIFGSQKSALIWQFQTEAVLLASIAVLFAFLLIELCLPLFNTITSMQLELNLLQNPEYFLGLFIISLVIGFLSGLYPAFMLSGLSPVSVLKSMTARGSRGAFLRKFLIVMQFTISIALIIGTLIVVKQLNFARNKDMGFDKENVMVITVKDSLINRNIPALKQELTSNPNILGAAVSLNLPGTTFNRGPFRLDNNEGVLERNSCQFMQIDYEFIETMDMTILEGRNFDREHETEWFRSVLVNETTVKRMGWDEALDKRVYAFEDSLGNITYLNVIGVVSDFHPNSVREQIHPIIIYLIDDEQRTYYGGNKYLFVKMKGNDISSTIRFIEEKWEEFGTGNQMQYIFLDEQLARLYRNEEKLITLFSTFTFITIFIACLGLLGLASFTAEQRAKEIGIRKVLGSTVIEILVHLSKDFARLILLANIIAWPIAYFAMKHWLQYFAYKTGLSIWVFLLSGFAALLIALLTISVQTVKAAMSNPADVLQYE
ncbi:ABC transporter permease [Candidatus Cloacimonadota bacterium]